MWRDDSTPTHDLDVRGSRGRARVGGRRGGEGDGGSEEFVVAPHGLFPRPLDPMGDVGARGKLLGYFGLLGRTVAKALADQRLLDLPLSL